MITFGETLKSLRRKKKKTLRQVADYVGISTGYLSDIERGNRGIPSKDKLDAISIILGNGSDLILNRAADMERQSIDIQIHKLRKSQIDLLYYFLDKIHKLDEDRIYKIHNILYFI